VPFDLSILDEAIARIKRVTPSPPGSVRPEGIVTHEILGGETDKPRLFAQGYFLAWSNGGSLAIVPLVLPTDVDPGDRLTNIPDLTVTSPTGGIANFPLRFTVVDGGGFLEDGKTVVETVTDGSGRGTVSSWTMGPVAGVNAVLVEGFGISSRFTITTD